ncbi:interferon-inducible double-stranded RNA-dependent protein kinase activator A homolog [Genypterus blacodes]|uniref:interferon-inducible double-stranded RNA-dependent protein kinase activator A homolog n=1 Tax=Genypterus blacodes TaxID=154954 RepID=UPI003F7661C0
MAQEGFQSPAVNRDTHSLKEPESSNPEKTPVQILYEYGLKTSNLPVYLLEKSDGAAHQPSFVYSVTIGDVCCTGQGPTKKAAQHRAAESVLRALQIDFAPVRKLPVPSGSNNGAAEPNNLSNSVGRLQELALQKRWRFPEYTYGEEAGPQHKREFTVTCQMESLSETAVAKTIKAAKQAAAEKMVSKLQNMSSCGETTRTPEPSVGLDCDVPGNVPSDDGLSPVRKLPVPSGSNNGAAEPNNLSNSVGTLQELTVRRGWRPPKYECLKEAGPPHQREFTVACQVESLSETAVADSIKAARKAAAGKMLQNMSGCAETTRTPEPSVGLDNFEQTEVSASKELETYPMKSEKRGVCLIVNNYDFSNSVKSLSNREGTHVDERSLESVFKWLGFDVEIHQDRTGDEMLTLVGQLGQRDHSQMDCVVCCFLSHGREGGVYGVDGTLVNISELKEPLTGSECSSLVDKPKLFFIQACQGNKTQRAVQIQADGPESDSVHIDASSPGHSIPSHADFVISKATVSNFVSFRDTICGTWYIQSLCRNLIQHVPSRTDLLSILTQVNADVAKMSKCVPKVNQLPQTEKQMPQPDFSIRKRVIFPVPRGAPPILTTCLKEPESSNPEKTPIQILHEYGIKSGNLPVYLLEKADGEAHQPSFVFSVTVGDVCCTGQGPSKKAARHQAAESVLRALQIDFAPVKLPLKNEQNGEAVEPNNLPNSVGILQELALQRGWRFPEYTFLKEAGPPHKREFTVTCQMESLSETAVANSKKAAKKAAAEKMVSKLQNMSGCPEITWTPEPSVRFENLRNSTAEKMSLLRRSPLSIPNTDYIQIMLDLSKEQGFEVTYFDIDELTVNGQYQCLAELSTSPVIVCHGTGISCSNAHNDAAHSALQYIKIMASAK